MTKDQFKLVCVKEPGDNGWCVYSKAITGLVVQVESLKDAPKKLSKMMEMMFNLGFEKETHDIIEDFLDHKE